MIDFMVAARQQNALNEVSYRELQRVCRGRGISAGGKRIDLVRRLGGGRGGNGRMRAASGVGYEITRSSRNRRAFGVMAGLMASADRHQTRHTLGTLRELCRMHDRQSALFSGILDRALDNIFGANFDFIPMTGDSGLNKQVKAYITRRMEPDLADAAGVGDFGEIARTALRAIWNDGDCLLVKRKDGSLMAFEADQIVTPGSGQAEGKRIVMGVEMNDLNRHQGYYVKSRPSKGDSGMTMPLAKARRVAAADVFMPAYRKRFNQTRGVPFLAAALATFDRTNNYLDYESLAAEANSMLGWKITKQPTDQPMAGVVDNEDTATSRTFEKVQKMEPLQVFELAIGEDVDMIGSNRPGVHFESYLVTCCRIIGVAVGFPLELMMLDFSKTNYSSARASLGEARRMFRVWQKAGGRQICLPWYRWQIGRGIAAGELPARAELYKVRCQWPAWEYIDPMKEARGNQLAIDAHTKSISQCIRETGGEPDEIFEEIASDKKKLAEFGLIEKKDTGAQAMENIARGVRAGVPIAVGEARASLGLSADPPEGGDLLRFNDQDVLQYHIESGILTINEIRERLGLPTVDWGDQPVRKTGVGIVDTSKKGSQEKDEEPEELDEEQGDKDGP